jgi:plasmid stabilization system protein ParE
MFEYRWLEAALDKLADIYVAADAAERERMAAGVEGFNAQIAADPLDVGESRVGGYRVAFPPLLRVYFHVDEGTHRVWVTDVTRYGR